MSSKAREFSPSEHEIICMTAALTSAKIRHGSCEDPLTTSVRYCTCYWRLVFFVYFNDRPEGNCDPRWEALFALGFPVFRALRKIDGSPP